MKVKIKSREELLRIFEEEGYEKLQSRYIKKGDSKNNPAFNVMMFQYCGKEVVVAPLTGEKYNYIGNSWGWMKEWVVPISRV